MATTSVIMNLNQMIDLAVNAPELGVVNFRVLGALLHVIVQQLQLNACNVEYRGKDSDQIQSLLNITQKSNPISLTEYVVSPDDLASGKGAEAGKKIEDKRASLGNDTTIVLVEPKLSDRGPHVSVAISKNNFDKIQSDISELQGKVQEMMDLPGNLGILETTRNPDATKAPIVNMFNMMSQSNRITSVEDGLEKLASLLEDMARSSTRGGGGGGTSTRGGGGTSTRGGGGGGTSSRQKSKRPRGSKTSTGGGASPKGEGAPPANASVVSPTASTAENTDAESKGKQKRKDSKTSEGKDSKTSEGKNSKTSEGKDREEGLDEDGQNDKEEVKGGANGSLAESDKRRRSSLANLGSILELEDRVSAIEEKLVKLDEISAGISMLEINNPRASMSTAGTFKGDDSELLLKLRQKVKEIGDKVGGLLEITKQVPAQEIVQLLTDLKRNQKASRAGLSIASTESLQAGLAEMHQEFEKRLGGLEERLDDRSKDMFNLNTTINNQLSMLQSQFTDMEKDMASLLERMNSAMPNGDVSNTERGIADIYNKLQEQQADLELLAEHARRLSEEKEERQLHMDALIEQVEVLKTIKADREDLEDALADKADACAINRKVSHDQFNTACDELSRGIEETLAKLSEQESLWQAALDDIQHEIGNKLDKMELSPLRDFINHKLKHLQDRLKALAALKKETEAAGTKSKFLRNVNCISCDKDVVMQKDMNSSLYPPAPSMPAAKNLGPYLAYELDALRKQQKLIPGARNLNHFESATGTRKARGDDHLCNRYCGGSHTVTTPQQRVTRLGHFLEQWGPEVLPAGEGTMKGTDGHMYKSDEPTKEAEMLARQSLVIQGVSTPRPSLAQQKTGSKTNMVEVPEKDSTKTEPRASVANGKKRDSSHVSVQDKRGSSSASVGKKTGSGRLGSARGTSKTSQKSASAQSQGEGRAPPPPSTVGDEEAAAEGEGEVAASPSKTLSATKAGSQVSAGKTSIAGASKGSKHSKVSVVPETIPEGDEHHSVTTEDHTEAAAAVDKPAEESAMATAEATEAVEEAAAENVPPEAVDEPLAE